MPVTISSKNKSFDQKLQCMKLEEPTFGTPCKQASKQAFLWGFKSFYVCPYPYSNGISPLLFRQLIYKAIFCSCENFIANLLHLLFHLHN